MFNWIRNRDGRRKFKVIYTPEMVWLVAHLRELTYARTDTAVLRRALQIYETAIFNYEKRRYLFSARWGKRPAPIHLLNPKSLVHIPPEASQLQPVTQTIVVIERQVTRLNEFIRKAKVSDLSALVEKALYFYFDLLHREFRGEVFFVSDPDSYSFQPVQIFIREDDTPDPAA